MAAPLESKLSPQPAPANAAGTAATVMAKVRQARETGLRRKFAVFVKDFWFRIGFPLPLQS
jgi:hypothetical protein